MTEEIIKEWLADYAALGPDEIHTYANTVHHNTQVINAVFAVLDDRQKHSDLVDQVCTTLFGFYRSTEIELKRFTLVFLPTLIYVYLNAVAHGEKKTCRGIEALLVGLYNLEAVDESCQAQNISFRLPSLAQASLYHEPPTWLHIQPYETEVLYGIPKSELYLNVLQPMSLAPASLTESALRRLEECNSKLVRWGPLAQLEKIIPQNRLVVMTALLFIYNQHISCLQKYSLDQLCKVVCKLVTQGFNKPGKRVSYSTDVPRVLPRIPVSPKLLLEVLSSLYFAMFNGDSVVALQAVEEVHHRACYQGYTDVMLVTNAIKNSRAARSGQITDNPMGISLAISPATNTSTVSKSMITNASFRTKKLPDDIPIQINKGEGEGTALGSISEEKEEGGTAPAGDVMVSGGPTRRSLPKMAVNFGKKTRERLSKGGKGGKSVNGGESWDGGGGVLEDGAETDSGVGADSELSSTGKISNNGSTPHDLDSRTMQVSSV